MRQEPTIRFHVQGRTHAEIESQAREVAEGYFGAINAGCISYTFDAVPFTASYLIRTPRAWQVEVEATLLPYKTERI